jgi:hypothetical protein
MADPEPVFTKITHVLRFSVKKFYTEFNKNAANGIVGDTSHRPTDGVMCYPNKTQRALKIVIYFHFYARNRRNVDNLLKPRLLKN